MRIAREFVALVVQNAIESLTGGNSLAPLAFRAGVPVISSGSGIEAIPATVHLRPGNARAAGFADSHSLLRFVVFCFS